MGAPWYMRHSPALFADCERRANRLPRLFAACSLLAKAKTYSVFGIPTPCAYFLRFRKAESRHRSAPSS